MSFTTTVSQYHDAMAAAMRPFRGQVLATGRIIGEVIAAYPDLENVRDWLKPPDHSRNHANDGDCECARTTRAIFEKVKHGRYRIL